MAAEDNGKEANPDHSGSKRMRHELVLLGAALLLGLLIVPTLIHYVGLQVFGSGTDPATLGDFLGRYFAGLGAMNKTVWLLALSPYLLLWWLRLVRLPLRQTVA